MRTEESKVHETVVEFDIVTDRVIALYEVVDELEEELKTREMRRFRGRVEVDRA